MWLYSHRDTSSIATPLDTSGTPPPPSLPSHFTLPTPNKPALYGRPTMQSGDYHSLVQPRLSLLTATNLTWGYTRLVRVTLHSNKATGWNLAVSEYIDTYFMIWFVSSWSIYIIIVAAIARISYSHLHNYDFYFVFLCWCSSSLCRWLQ